MILLCAAAVYVALLIWSPWSPWLTLRHIVARPNCDAARMVGLAPAVGGNPGYWPQHDRDEDGIACEHWPP
ncbi:MAG: excalibur calcium-binding domain-containing protein [Alphaproteobacteria bacterium]